MHRASWKKGYFLTAQIKIKCLNCQVSHHLCCPLARRYFSAPRHGVPCPGPPRPRGWQSCTWTQPMGPASGPATAGCGRAGERAPEPQPSWAASPTWKSCWDEQLLLPLSHHSRPAGELPGLKGAELELFQGEKNTEPGFQINLLTSTLKRASPQPPTAEPSPSTWALSLGTGCPRAFSKQLSPLRSTNA